MRPIALFVTLILGACASLDHEPYTLETWPSTAFYPHEFCWDLGWLDKNTPGYQNLADWCSKREGRGDGFAW